MVVCDYLPDEARETALGLGKRLTGVRLRPGQPVQLVYPGGDVLSAPITRAQFDDIAIALMGHSLYARQRELIDGYFTLPDGSRAGVCGRFGKAGPSSVQDIGSVSIRVAREIKGCADEVIDRISAANGTVIISPPGIGKTTLLRDIARQLSCKGRTVCIIDERGEIAACHDGAPTLDVGPRTDVITGCAKHEAIIKAVRACAPQVIVTDEIGDVRDADALNEACRCGVQVIASAHGTTLDISSQRAAVRDMLSDGMFELGILLGPDIGRVRGIRNYAGKDSDTDG